MGSVKRGRPVGSKNKPKTTKTIRLTNAQVVLANKMGVPVEQYAKELVALNNKPKNTVKKFNWERLAKQLQTALNDEIVENNGLFKEIDDLKFQVANLKHQAIGYRAVVSYLENKIEHDTVRSN
jgi:tRNA A37 N6-isopentenylltransferase MiaA